MASFQIKITEDEGIDIHCDGEFIASWSSQIAHIMPKSGELYLSSRAVINMLSSAFDAGEKARSKEIRNILGVN
jgi:hypothetical protein